MADVSTYIFLALVTLPPLLRQARRLVYSVRTRGRNSPSQPPRPAFLSSARLTPFATPFSSAISIATLLLVLASIRNLVPVQYGLDIFIPSSTIKALHTIIYAQFPASVQHRPLELDNALHVDLLKGAYKPDLFLAYKAPVTVPTTTLRNLINHAPHLLPIGHRNSATLTELQELIARLSSFEARRVYLILGAAPLLECTFCTKLNDHFWYAVPFLLAAYAWRILAIGLLTTHPDDSVAVAIRQAATLFGSLLRNHQQQAASPASIEYQADRSNWRIRATTLLVGLLAVELLIMFEFAQLTAGASRFNHWHSNLHIFRQIVFLTLVLAIYLFPAPRVADSFKQTMHHLDVTQDSLQNLVQVADLADVSHQVIIDDHELLDISRKWRQNITSAAMTPSQASRVIQMARTHGGQAASDAVAQAHNGIRTATRSWWRNLELLNQRADSQANAAGPATFTHPASASSAGP